MNEYSLPEMRSYFSKLGYSMTDLNNLNVIHIAGTKGKGSTAAFTESILRRFGLRTGLYTSPHLIEVRERIRIDGNPLDRSLFARRFEEVWTKLLDPKPSYFRFLTLIAFHAFIQEKVDVAIIEVGIGGEYDCTNIIEKPICCAITSIGYDHQSILGNTLEDIAWHKAGIMKNGVKCVSSIENQKIWNVLKRRSMDKNAILLQVENDKDNLRIGIPGEHQKLNATIALECSKIALESLNVKFEEKEAARKFKDGLELTKWPGRSQTITIGKVTFFIDGAHTPESIAACVRWFKETCKISKKHIVFYVSGKRKNVNEMINQFLDLNIEQAMFPLCRAVTDPKDAPEDLINNMTDSQEELSSQEQLSLTWEKFTNKKNYKTQRSVEECIKEILEANEEKAVLVTGSLHLIGAVLFNLNRISTSLLNDS